MFYTSKPQTVEAVQWKFYTDDSITATDSFDEIQALGASVYIDKETLELYLYAGVDGAQGYVPVPERHWIIKGAPNDFWPVEDEYFRAKYEVNDAQS